MIKIIVLLCSAATPPLQCTEDTAQAIVMADHQDDGTACKALSDALLEQVGKNPKIDNRVMIACQKDGKPFP
jgi:hypothetical protein